MSGRLTGKIAIVTGGTSGIGETTVRLFVSEGARVVIVARRAGPGEQLVAELGPDATRFISGDVASEATARTAIDLAESWGGLDVLVNNAAMDWVSPILDTSEADVRRVLDTNFIGAFLMQREAARRMLERRRGSIINLTSRNASVGVPTMGLYAAASLAYPAVATQRATGILLGVAVLYVVNLIRVLSLIYFGHLLLNFFEAAHVYVWQALFLAVVAALWLGWVSRVRPVA